MRNANHNFVRKFAVHNKEYAKLYGDTIDTQNPPVGVTVPSRSLYAYQSKCTTPYNHPEGLYSNSKTLRLTVELGLHIRINICLGLPRLTCCVPRHIWL